MLLQYLVTYIEMKALIQLFYVGIVDSICVDKTNFALELAPKMYSKNIVKIFQNLTTLP